MYYNYSERCYCMMPPRHVYPKLCHLFFSKSVLEPVQQPHKLHVHITHLLVINSKGQMPVCHTSSSPIHVINLCMTSLHIFTALPFTIYRTPLTRYRWATCPPPGSSPRCSSWMARSIAVGNRNHCRSFLVRFHTMETHPSGSGINQG